MKAMSYNTWKLSGFHVKRGEVSTLIGKDGEALFTRDQVEDDYESTPGAVSDEHDDDNFYYGD